MVLKESAWLLGIGVAIVVVLALLSSRLVASLLFGIEWGRRHPRWRLAR